MSTYDPRMTWTASQGVIVRLLEDAMGDNPNLEPPVHSFMGRAAIFAASEGEPKRCTVVALVADAIAAIVIAASEE